MMESAKASMATEGGTVASFVTIRSVAIVIQQRCSPDREANLLGEWIRMMILMMPLEQCWLNSRCYKLLP